MFNISLSSNGKCPVFSEMIISYYSDVNVYRGETVSKATAVCRKIDLKITCRGKNQGKNVELSHSECARRTTPAKIINDRSKCLRANKSVLDQYLSHDLSDEVIENSVTIGLQLAGKCFNI